ncbi:MAG: hypothetical protein KC649_00235 [Candidatus Omnitrophica bacterium]|nr:hypothetical protein [Candidatus Omnitrophota bacterium]
MMIISGAALCRRTVFAFLLASITLILSIQADANAVKTYDFSALYELDGINPPNSAAAQKSVNHSRFQDDPTDLPAVQDIIQNRSAIKSDFTPESIHAVNGAIRGGRENNFNNQKNLLQSPQFQPPQQILPVNSKSGLTD